MKIRSGFRKIIIDGKLCQFKIGNKNTVIFDENGVRHLTNHSEISGWSWDQVERGLRKKYFSVTPGMISEYIRNGYKQKQKV